MKREDLEFKSSLSLLEKGSDLDKVALTDKLPVIVQDILNRRFVGVPEKTKIHLAHDKINFACPYCGDSDKTSRKKRGNIFLDTLHYHCFNCLSHKSLQQFLSDYDKSNSLTPGEFIELHKVSKINQLKYNKTNSFSWDSLLGMDIKTMLPLKEDLMQKLQLKPILESNNFIKSYLRGRLQLHWDNFAFSQERNHLYIFNLSSDGKHVIGYQVRQFKSDVKYLSYNLLKVYEDLELTINTDVEELNKLSLVFNILKVDFNLPITIFEGPLDAFLFDNSVATSSANNKIPFDIANIRYLYDNPNTDKTGKKKSIEALIKGDSVFLWTKYLKENKLPLTLKDWNDLMIYAYRNQLKITRPEACFSKSKFDLYEL